MTAALEPILRPPPRLDTAWQARARCRGQDVDLFYAPDAAPEDGPAGRGVIDNAITFCRPCRARRDCLLYALALPPGKDHGVWGGTSRNQRRQIRDGDLTLDDALADPTTPERTTACPT